MVLELLRFAAANRLCVELRYQEDLHKVEPYSLRRTQWGDVVLYACEAYTTEYLAYRNKELSEVEITGQAFVPKYANELLPPSRQG